MLLQLLPGGCPLTGWSNMKGANPLLCLSNYKRWSPLLDMYDQQGLEMARLALIHWPIFIY